MLFYNSSEATILDSYRRILKQDRIGSMIHLFNNEGMAHLISRTGHSHIESSVNPTIFTHEILIGHADYTISKHYSSRTIDITLTTQHVNPYHHTHHAANWIVYERALGKFLPISKQPLPLGKLRILIFKGVKSNALL